MPSSITLDTRLAGPWLVHSNLPHLHEPTISCLGAHEGLWSPSTCQIHAGTIRFQRPPVIYWSVPISTTIFPVPSCACNNSETDGIGTSHPMVLAPGPPHFSLCQWNLLSDFATAKFHSTPIDFNQWVVAYESYPVSGFSLSWEILVDP